jgi:RHS repeat-associated protein
MTAGGEKQDRQPYKYGNKELDEMNGLNLYDFLARGYDPAIGRFMSIDPLAEKYYSVSPYAYCLNNPIKYVDPTGEIPTPIEGAVIAGHIYNGKEGEVLQGGWTLDRVFTSPESKSYRAGLYSRPLDDGTTEYAFANAGTYPENSSRGWGSISENFEQVWGGSEDMKASLRDVDRVNKELGSAELTFVGHSKGGAEAAGNALATNRNALLYNPAAINASAYGLDSKSYTGTDSNGMTVYVVKGDALNSLNKALNSKAIDKIIYLPSQSSNPITNHSIETVIKALQEYYNNKNKQ